MPSNKKAQQQDRQKVNCQCTTSCENLISTFDTYADDPAAYAPKQGAKPKPLYEDKDTGHKCVDCGKPTPDHRCPKCLKAWRVKHKVHVGDDYAPMTYSVRW